MPVRSPSKQGEEPPEAPGASSEEEEEAAGAGGGSGDEAEAEGDMERHAAMLEAVGAGGAAGRRRRTQQEQVQTEAYPESEYNLPAGAGQSAGARNGRADGLEAVCSLWLGLLLLGAVLVLPVSAAQAGAQPAS